MSTAGISSALNAYQQALGRIGAKIESQQETHKAVDSGFQNMVKDVVGNAVDLSSKAERMSMQMVTGKADIQDVVLAVSNAEVALETVVAVRDTAIKAYKDIMSMPI